MIETKTKDEVLYPLQVKAYWDWFWRAPFHRLLIGFISLVRILFFIVGLQKPFWSIENAETKALTLASKDIPGAENQDETAKDGATCAAFVDNVHREILEILLPELESCELGSMSRVIPIAKILEKKLRVEQYLKKYPTASSLVIPAPVWILSLPRTGSTWLHKLLSLDRSCRTMKSWELKFPVPLNECQGSSRLERFNMVKKQHEVLYKLAPRMRKIHYVAHDDPDECVQGFLDPCLVDMHAWGLLQLKNTYDAFVSQPALSRSIYENYRKLVKCVLHQEKNFDRIEETPNNLEYSHTVFKSPHHLLSMHSLGKVFSGSKYVWLHRNPLNVVGSCCSMNLAVFDYFAAKYQSKRELGKRTLARLANSVKLGLKSRKELESQGVEIVDIYYEDLKADTVGTIKRIYEAFNLDFTEQFEAALVQETDLRNKIGKKTKPGNTHSYTLEEFGLLPEDVAEAFDEYLKEFPRVATKTAGVTTQ